MNRARAAIGAVVGIVIIALAAMPASWLSGPMSGLIVWLASANPLVAIPVAIGLAAVIFFGLYAFAKWTVRPVYRQLRATR